MNLKELYMKNPVYAPRYEKDKLFIFPQGSAKFAGVFDEAIRFVAENQCKTSTTGCFLPNSSAQMLTTNTTLGVLNIGAK